jgi:hypothetical protein
MLTGHSGTPAQVKDLSPVAAARPMQMESWEEIITRFRSIHPQAPVATALANADLLDSLEAT